MPLARQRYGEPWQDDPYGSHEHLKGRADPEADCEVRGRHARRKTDQEGASVPLARVARQWRAMRARLEPGMSHE